MLMNGTCKWQRLYEAAILETDRSRLPALIAEAQAAIDARMDALSAYSDGKTSNGKIDIEAYRIFEEKQALADALSGIRILKRAIKTEVA
jgi:hypothetical protein